MEAKDVALLGFVSCAKEYINKHINDDVDFGDLNNLDVHKLADELSAELKNYQGNKDDVRALLKSGGDAFSEYVKEHLEVKQGNIVDALGSVFDFGTGKVLDEAFEDEEEPVTEKKEDIASINLAITNDIADKIIKEEIGEKEKPVSYDDYGLSDDDAILQMIASSASKTNEELARRNDVDENLDSVLSDVVDNERKAALNPDLEPEEIKEVVKDVEVTPVIEEPYVYDPSKIVYIENPGLAIIDKLNGGIIDFYDHEDEDENDEDYHVKALAAIANKGEDYASYNTELTKEEKEEIERIIDNIQTAYPYLSRSFINAVYNLKDTIDVGLDEGAGFVILHRLKFKDIERLREFVEVMMNHDYLVNVDEDKMIVDTFKELRKQEGVAILDIMTIANQAKVLEGNYEGYRLIRKGV